MSRAIDLARWIGGFVAAEGCFTGAGPRRFVFRVGLSAADEGVCHDLRRLFGVGHITRSPRRKAHYHDEVTLAVGSMRDLVEVIVPFMDEHLPPSYKRLQYERWRARLLDYWANRAKRQRPCRIEGCDAVRRAKGLCRRHYYQAYRR